MAASNSGEVPHMATVAELHNVPLPPRDWLKQGMEEVEESLAELWTEFGWLQRDGELARWRRSSRQRWRLSVSPQ
jgi:hypothetical protein